MRPFRIIGVILVGLSLSAALSFPSNAVFAQSSTATLTNEVKTADFDTEVQTFLEKELAAHLGAIASMNPPPDRVLGVPTTGEFS